MATDKGKQLLSATSIKGLHHGIRKVVLVHTGSVDTSMIVSRLRETYGCEVALVTDAVGHVGSGKGQSSGDFNEPEGALNKLCASLLTELNMVENQLLGGTVQATTCLELKPIQFEVPYVGVSFDPLRQLASPGGTAGFCELGYAESAYGGMFDPFWESDLLILKGKAIQFHAKSAYAGMRFDQFQKSAPPSVTFLAAGSCEPFDPFRQSASPGGTAGFCELGYAESAYGGMSFDLFWESDLLILKGKAIQFHAKSAYAGMRFDQLRKSAPPSVTFLAAGSCEPFDHLGNRLLLVEPLVSVSLGMPSLLMGACCLTCVLVLI